MSLKRLEKLHYIFISWYYSIDHRRRRIWQDFGSITDLVINDFLGSMDLIINDLRFDGSDN